MRFAVDMEFVLHCFAYAPLAKLRSEEHTRQGQAAHKMLLHCNNACCYLFCWGTHCRSCVLAWLANTASVDTRAWWSWYTRHFGRLRALASRTMRCVLVAL